MPASGLLAHTLISRFADHLPYYRQEAINARSGVHTPRSTLAAWAGQAGAALEPLYELHKRFVLGCRVLHADETPVALLDPGAGKTRRAYVWAYARSGHDPTPGVVYDFCLGRGAQYPVAFLAGDERVGHRRWAGTLLTDRYSAYDTVLDERLHPDRRPAACVAHARRKFDELAKAGTSALGEEAIRRLARIYEIEGELGSLDDARRQAARQELAHPLWDKLKQWLELERRLVVDGGPAAAAIDYTLKHWGALTRHLDDGAVPIGRVEMWRGGGRSGIAVSAPFGWRCPISRTVTPFPHPPRRTGRADLPHPALFQRIRPSRSSGCVRTAAGVSVPASRRGTGRSIGGTPFPACRCAVAARSADAARCSRPVADRSV